MPLPAESSNTPRCGSGRVNSPMAWLIVTTSPAFSASAALETLPSGLTRMVRRRLPSRAGALEKLKLRDFSTPLQGRVRLRYWPGVKPLNSRFGFRCRLTTSVHSRTTDSTRARTSVSDQLRLASCNTRFQASTSFSGFSQGICQNAAVAGLISVCDS